jgi:hypothetical protein
MSSRERRTNMNKMLELSDLNEAAFLEIEGIEVKTTKRAGRVYWTVPADQRTYEALARLREDPLVPALTFIRHLKKLRAVMLDARSNGNGYEIRGKETDHGRADS